MGLSCRLVRSGNRSLLEFRDVSNTVAPTGDALVRELAEYTTLRNSVPRSSVALAMCERALTYDLLVNPRGGVVREDGTVGLVRGSGPVVVGAALPPPNGQPLHVGGAGRPFPEAQRHDLESELVMHLRATIASMLSTRAMLRAPGTESAGGYLAPVVAVAGALVVSAALVRWIDGWTEARELEVANDVRVHEARLAAASRAYAERLVRFDATGTMPPPSELERAALVDVQAAARRAETSWDELAADAGKGVKWVAGAAAVGLLLWASK